MHIPTKKLKNGFTLPVYGFGAYGIGGKTDRDEHNDDDRDIRAMQAALDVGITHFDTAEKYAEGFSEKLIAQAIKHHDRSKLFITSKVRPEYHTYDGIIKNCNASLQRLETNYLDLYLLHAYSVQHSLQAAIRALDYLLENGLVKNIGVSNFGIEHLAEAQRYTKNKIVCDQVHYNVAIREVEQVGLLKYCQDNDIFLVAWRPLGKGKLLENPPKLIIELAEKYQKTPAQIVLNWLISQKNVVTIPKTSDIEHLKENLGALEWRLSDEDIEKIRRDYPDQKAISDIHPLG